MRKKKMAEHDHPFEEVAETANARIKEGWTIFQKFTCQNCRRRITIGVPNAFFAIGHCEECGHDSDLMENGCNYLAAMGGSAEEILTKILNPEKERRTH